jgi:hypothetical protein
MFYPTTTGLQVASHDAWLAEMKKEPSPELGRVARPEAEGHLRTDLAFQLAEMAEPVAEGQRKRGLASRLAGVVKRLWSRRWPAVPKVPDAPAQTKGANV